MISRPDCSLFAVPHLRQTPTCWPATPSRALRSNSSARPPVPSPVASSSRASRRSRCARALGHRAAHSVPPPIAPCSFSHVGWLASPAARGSRADPGAFVTQYDPSSAPTDMTFKYYNADEVRCPPPMNRCAQDGSLLRHLTPLCSAPAPPAGHPWQEDEGLVPLLRRVVAHVPLGRPGPVLGRCHAPAPVG